LIPLLPPFNNLSTNDAIQNQSANPHTTPRCWNGPDGAAVGALSGPPCGHLIARYNLIVDGEPQVGKRGEQASHHLFESVHAEVWFWAAVDVYDAIGRERLVSSRNISAIQAFDPRPFVGGNVHKLFPREKCESRVMLSGKYMPKTPKGHKRPADVVSNAVRVMKIATGEIEESDTTGGAKSQAAVQLGSRGGKARAKKLGVKRRKEIARQAAAARWRK